MVVQVGGITHWRFPRDNFLALQSWKYREGTQCIKITFDNGVTDQSDYENEALWSAILRELDRVIVEPS